MSGMKKHQQKRKKVLIALSASRQARGAHGKKVLIAMSGGIDSAVSAYLLLKQGFEVEAAFMKNWSSSVGLLKNKCPWLVDRQDALRVAAFLRIPLHTLDFEKQYQKTVMKYFFDEYKKGRTPNPDVMCNKEIKFKLLYNWALKNGFDYLATGHYARVGMSECRNVGKRSVPIYRPSKQPINGHATLMRSVDEFKDQTYFIYNIKPQQLPRLLFPIGAMKKTAVRLLARRIGLPNAEKKESMGLCFVGKIRLKDFLEQKLTPRPGPIVLLSAEESSRAERGISSIKRLPRSPKGSLAMTGGIIGRHQGLFNYTIGQRQGIKVGGTGPYYVIKKDLKTNTLYVTNNPNDKALLTKEVQVHSINWILQKLGNLEIGKLKLQGRYRHQGELVPLKIKSIGKNHYRAIFNKPQKAVASGQSLVLYKGKECVGGGVIV
jgi:tRNA-specific 2-thiouridylase